MNYMCVCRYILVGVSQPAGCETGAASCDGTQATRISQDTKLVVGWGGGGSLVIVCGHVRRQRRECGVWGVSRGWDNC